MKPPVSIRNLLEPGCDGGAGDRAALPRRMTSAAEAGRWREAAWALIEPALPALAALLPPQETTEQRGEAAIAARAGAALDDFEAVYDIRPVCDNGGGSGFNDSLWLWLVARLAAPDLVVESGTHKGHTAWLFRQACPSAEIHSFDISWTRLAHRAPGVKYHLRDWSEDAAAPLAAAGRRSLAFLDDHVSHARRIVEAHARGHRLLLLDDDFPAHQLYATGGPPLPTLSMILDPALADGREIAWTRNGKAYAFRFERKPAEAARRLLAGWLTLPELAPATRRPCGSGLALVKLVD